MLYVGLVLGLAAGDYAANLQGLNGARVVAATLLLLVVALIGARLLFVITHWRLFRDDRRRVWNRAGGGGAMFGGLPPALVVSVPLLAALQLPLAAYWDIATITMLIAVAVARMGCLLHGCCGGSPSDRWFAIELSDHRGVRCSRIPVQLFDALLALLILIGVIVFWNQRPFPGAAFLTATAAYALGRAALEPTRAEQPRAGGMRLGRLIAATLAAAAISGFVNAWLIAGN